jgi:hypothetical protein
MSRLSIFQIIWQMKRYIIGRKIDRIAKAAIALAAQTKIKPKKYFHLKRC